MSEEVFAKRRQIKSQESRPCIVPGFVLSYAMDGIPFIEPCFATCVKREHSPYPNPRPDVHGVAFLITESEFTRVLATEGGSGWNDGSCGGYRVSEVEAVDYQGKKMNVLTLTNLPEDNYRPMESYKNCPSERYKNLVVNGAKQSNIDPNYIKWLETQQSYDKSQHGLKQRIALVVQVLFFLPLLFSMLVGNFIFMRLCGKERTPWIVVKVTFLYRQLLKVSVLPLLTFFVGSSGYYTTSVIPADDRKDD